MATPKPPVPTPKAPVSTIGGAAFAGFAALAATPEGLAGEAPCNR